MGQNVFRGLLLLTLVLPVPAMAVLGGDANTLEADRVQMKATVKSSQAQAYAVHEMNTPTGLIIRQYVSPQGKVFGISWRGPVAPNLRQLLGGYFQQVSEAAQAQRKGRVMRGPMFVQQPGVVFQQAGHMRSYFGRAYVPEMLPQGVGPEAVR